MARRRLWVAAAAGAVLLLLALGADYVLEPRRATALLLDEVGERLGLEIRAGGADYQLRGTPQLVLRDVVAIRPGDPVPVLRAERAFVSLPWATIRSRGAALDVQRVELDAPVLDIPALQRWRATRPPGAEPRIPTLLDGLRVVRGRIENEGWRIDGIALDLPALAPDKPLRARLQGRFVDPPVRVPFDLDVAMSAPASDAGLAALGAVSVIGEGWRLPGRLHLSGPLHLGADELRIAPARIGFSGRYLSASSSLPFALGAHGPLRFAEGVWSLDPASLALRGAGPIPDAGASGALAMGRRLVLRLDGRIAAWPDAWPALPPPLSQSRSPLPFAIDYAGRANLADPTTLRLRRDATSFDAEFRLPRVLDWLDADGAGTPLPPLDGRLRTPRLEIAGASLVGVEMDFEDEQAPPDPTP
jgi:hypothetical protein